MITHIKKIMPRISSIFSELLSKTHYIYFPLSLCFMETVLHLYAYKSLSADILWVLLFSIGIGGFFTFLTNLFPKKVNLILTFVFAGFFTLLFETQLVYFAIFKGFASVSMAALGAQAVTNFTGAMFEGIRSCIHIILILLIPMAILIFTVAAKKAFFPRLKKFISLIPLAVSVLIISLTVAVMAIFFSGSPSLYEAFNSSKSSTDISTKHFGLTITMVQEIRWMIFPFDENVAAETLSTAVYGDEYQVDPKIDFAALYEKADSEELKKLTASLSNIPASTKNEYTGICEGYNLIAICAEAFSPEFITPELTPTLYKLINSGFVFNNFYATFPNTTTNGEYSFCTGLLPDLSRGKTESSFGLSATHYLPYCYGNLFSSIGANAVAYHNYVAEFYHRDYTHVNMGYDFVAANSGLDIELLWPSSDHDMMIQSVDDYMGKDEQFVAYYMTFSGHYQYDLTNAMSAKNWNIVADLPYSDAVRAYIACNLELEMAMTHIMDSLEAAGIADKTVIVLTTDHYPYGLNDEQYEELAGREINDIFDKQKNAFICYVPGMETKQIDTYCSSIDILPTVLNLFGFTYDSRLMAGVDILADNVEHAAVLVDGSFITDGIVYDASTTALIYDKESYVEKKRAESLYLAVSKKFKISTDILNSDYYAFAYDEKGSDSIIEDPTTQYSDIGIMDQAAFYYLIKNELMDPMGEEKFGIKESATLAELLDVLYRYAESPDVSAQPDSPFFTTEEKFTSAALWAYEQGVLSNDELVSYDLDENATVGSVCLIVARFAKLFGIEPTADEVEVLDILQRYKNLDRSVIESAIFCRDNGLVIGDGMAEYPFYSATASVNRSFVAGTLYKLFTYMIQ